MIIHRAQFLGMCFGVRDAIQFARNEAHSAPITILGDLVHNPVVLQDLQARGIRIERDLDRVATPTVLITAHGASERRLQEVRARGFHLLEATCPLVRFAHQQLHRLVTAGFHPVIVGIRNHVEVAGLTGDLAEFDVVLAEADVDALAARPRFGVIAQTTQPVARVLGLVQRLRARFPDAEVRHLDTVCMPTKQRQNSAVETASTHDVVVVIGGANSNNTRELVETCRRHCARVHHVQSARDLRTAWFHPSDRVGITAGTSTPDETIDEVESWLCRLDRALTAAVGAAVIPAEATR